MAQVTTKINLVNQEELAERISEKSVYKKEVIIQIWNLMLEEMKCSIRKGEHIELEKGIQFTFYETDI